MTGDHPTGGLQPPATGELFFLDCPSWSQPSERLGGLGHLLFPVFCCPVSLWGHPRALSSEGMGVPAPHELICSLSTASTREKKALVEFPARQSALGKGEWLFLGNTDIKAEKEREQEQ